MDLLQRHLEIETAEMRRMMLGSRSCGFSGPDFYKLGDETTREKKWHKSADFGATEASFLVGRILSYTGVYTDIREHGWSWLILGLIWQFYAATTAFTSIYEQSVLQLIQSTRANVSTQTFRVEMVWEWLSHVGLVLKASFFFNNWFPLCTAMRQTIWFVSKIQRIPDEK